MAMSVEVSCGDVTCCNRFNVLSIDYVRVINCFYDYDYENTAAKPNILFWWLTVKRENLQPIFG